jgi:hypothetical protein
MLYSSLQLNVSDYESIIHKKLQGKGKSMLCNLEPAQNCPDKTQMNSKGTETAIKLFLLSTTGIHCYNKTDVFDCYNYSFRIKLSIKAFVTTALYINAT